MKCEKCEKEIKKDEIHYNIVAWETQNDDGCEIEDFTICENCYFHFRESEFGY